jgi:hypothetical protein
MFTITMITHSGSEQHLSDCSSLIGIVHSVSHVVNNSTSSRTDAHTTAAVLHIEQSDLSYCRRNKKKQCLKHCVLLLRTDNTAAPAIL